MSDEEQKDRIEFDRMPGSDAPEEPAAESLDLNFGLGEEPAEEPDLSLIHISEPTRRS